MAVEGKLAFKINEFEGPLDLLLHLIEKNNLELEDYEVLKATLKESGLYA